jgi:hypothetical protein
MIRRRAAVAGNAAEWSWPGDIPSAAFSVATARTSDTIATESNEVRPPHWIRVLPVANATRTGSCREFSHRRGQLEVDSLKNPGQYLLKD